MSVEKKFSPTYKIYSPSDLSKEWFIYWNERGKRRKKKGGINRFHTFNGRMAAANELVEAMERDYVLPSPIIDQMSEWLEEQKGRWRKKTYQTTKSRIDMFGRWLRGREVTPEIIKSFFIHLSNERHGRTHNDYLQWFRKIFKETGNTKIYEALMDINSVTAISTPAKYFQRHQIERIRKYVLENDPTLWLAIEFIYYCFIRPGELRLLRVGDIMFDEWKICIRAEVSKNKKQQYVTIPHAFRPSLYQLKHRSPMEYIFYHKDCTKHLAVNGLLNRFRRVLKTLGFGNEYKLYSWKHTGAVAAVKAGISLKELQIQLRHHSLDEVDKYLRQLGVWDLGSLEKMFPQPGEVRKNKDSEREIAKLMGEVAKMYPDRGVVEVLRELVQGA